MDPVTLSLILALIVKTVELAPQVVDLIRRAQAGEKITPEEIERTQVLVNDSVNRWRSAEKPTKEE